VPHRQFGDQDVEEPLMLNHLGIIVTDPGKSIPFYEACLAPMGLSHYRVILGKNGRIKGIEGAARVRRWRDLWFT